MRVLFHEALTVMVAAYERLEAQVPPPQEQPWQVAFVYRTLHQRASEQWPPLAAWPDPAAISGGS